MKFPTDEQYQKFLEKLHKMPNLNLCTGNCGMYAFALKEVFDCGKIINIDDCVHLLFEHNGKFYDGEQIYNSFEELKKSYWGEYIYGDEDCVYYRKIDDNLYNYVLKRTNHSIKKNFFKSLIEKEFKDNPLREMMRKRFGEHLIIPERMKKE